MDVVSFNNNQKKNELENRFFPNIPKFTFFPFEINHHLGISHAYRLWRLLALKKAMAPQPERLELGLKPPYLPGTLPSDGSPSQGGTKMEIRCMFFSRQVINDIGNF